jgi:hypothetical protein
MEGAPGVGESGRLLTHLKQPPTEPHYSCAEAR